MSKKKNDTTGTDKSTENRGATGGPTNDNQSQPERLIPLKAWDKYHDWPPIGGLRHIRFYSKKKRASHVFVKKGGLVLVRERAFWEWASNGDAS